MVFVFSSLNPIMTVEHRSHQNGNGHLIEKPVSLGVTPINGYDNPVLEDSLASDYMPTVLNGQCLPPIVNFDSKLKSLSVLTIKIINLRDICCHLPYQRVSDGQLTTFFI